MRYVVIGDSFARGFRLGLPARLTHREGDRSVWRVSLGWFDRPGTAYPAYVARGLRARGLAVEVDDRLAWSGAPSGAWWRGGPTEPVRRVLDRPADLVTVTLGGNDVITRWFPYLWAVWPGRALGLASPAARGRLLDRLAPDLPCAVRPLPAMEHALRALLEWMADGRAGRIVVTTYAGPDEREVVTERFTRPVNDAIRRAAAGVPGVRVVDLEALFAGHTSHSPRPQRWIQWRDGVHPNARGHRAIAGAVLARLEAPPHG